MQGLTQTRCGAHHGSRKTKFLEKGPKIRKNLAISKKGPGQKKPRINPELPAISPTTVKMTSPSS